MHASIRGLAFSMHYLVSALQPGSRIEFFSRVKRHRRGWRCAPRPPREVGNNETVRRFAASRGGATFNARESDSPTVVYCVTIRHKPEAMFADNRRWCPAS